MYMLGLCHKSSDDSTVRIWC